MFWVQRYGFMSFFFVLVLSNNTNSNAVNWCCSFLRLFLYCFTNCVRGRVRGILPISVITKRCLICAKYEFVSLKIVCVCVCSRLFFLVGYYLRGPSNQEQTVAYGFSLTLYQCVYRFFFFKLFFRTTE